jgi:putative NIF3 family GTP cyclohydrolase 1 type 2
MKPTELSRREFALLAGAGLAAAQPAGAAGTLTAREVIERIQKNVGVPWRTPTVDTVKAGDPEIPVTGISTTFMATLDMLRRSAKAGCNLVITHEPTFYNHQDETKDFANDAVYAFKRDFIAHNHMVVFRFHDHWHARKPDGMFQGLADAFGWQTYQSPADQRLFQIPDISLGDLVKMMQSRLQIRAPRIIGDAALRVRRVAVNAGYTSLDEVTRLMPSNDVFVCGEPREWEGVEYVQDAIAAGQKKGMIILGHEASEEPGMKVCAAWLKGIVKEVPVEWITAGEPFWRPSRDAG